MYHIAGIFVIVQLGRILWLKKIPRIYNMKIYILAYTCRYDATAGVGNAKPFHTTNPKTFNSRIKPLLLKIPRSAYGCVTP
jgi:hypothetical protein